MIQPTTKKTSVLQSITGLSIGTFIAVLALVVSVLSLALVFVPTLVSGNGMGTTNSQTATPDSTSTPSLFAPRFVDQQVPNDCSFKGFTRESEILTIWYGNSYYNLIDGIWVLDLTPPDGPFQTTGYRWVNIKLPENKGTVQVIIVGGAGGESILPQLPQCY